MAIARRARKSDGSSQARRLFQPGLEMQEQVRNAKDVTAKR
jgi:hypothetical protein